MGVARDKLKSNLAGATSHLQINEASPVFYLYFESSSNQNADRWFFATLAPPRRSIPITKYSISVFSLKGSKYSLPKVRNSKHYL